MLTYIVLFIVFLVAMKYLAPMLNNLNGHGPGGIQEQYKKKSEDNWQQIAQELNLEFTAIAKPEDKKVWQGGGLILKGLYKEKRIVIKFLHETREWAEGLKTGYEYFIDNRVTVFGVNDNEWQILPKDLAPQAVPTGVPTFDSSLAFIGDKSKVPAAVFEKCAQYGWMHLKQKEGTLTFIDDYAEFYQRKHGAMSVASMQHVVWGNSASSQQVSIERVRDLLDLLILAAS